MGEGAQLSGSVIGGKYRITTAIGSGGMGCLVKAEHLLLKTHVAIKFVRADKSASTRKRLFREARAAQSLSCEQVVRVFDLGVHEGDPYIVMELLEGQDLAQRVKSRGPLPIEEAVDCVLEACVAVAEAHARGIIHRDLKPGNLFATRTAMREIVKVLDFGISKVPETTEGDDCEQTADGVMLGTPHYSSPEQLRNPAKIDARTDVWALGVTLYHLVSGAHPFPGANVREVTAAIFSDPPRPLSEATQGDCAALWEVLARTLAKRPEDRVRSVETLVADLLPFASNRGRRAAEAVLGVERPPLAPLARPHDDDGLASPLSTTDAGLSSSLSSVHPQTEGADAAPKAVAGRWRLRSMIAVAVAATIAAPLFWLFTEEPPARAHAPLTEPLTEPPTAEVAAGSSLMATSDSITPSRPLALSEGAAGPHEMAGSHEVAGLKEAAGLNGTIGSQAASEPPAPLARAVLPNTAKVAAEPPAEVAPPAASNSATRALVAPSPEPPRDIDGVPIVD